MNFEDTTFEDREYDVRYRISQECMEDDTGIPHRQLDGNVSLDCIDNVIDRISNENGTNHRDTIDTIWFNIQRLNH